MANDPQQATNLFDDVEAAEIVQAGLYVPLECGMGHEDQRAPRRRGMCGALGPHRPGCRTEPGAAPSARTDPESAAALPAPSAERKPGDCPNTPETAWSTPGRSRPHGQVVGRVEIVYRRDRHPPGRHGPTRTARGQVVGRVEKISEHGAGGWHAACSSAEEHQLTDGVALDEHRIEGVAD